MRIGISVNSTYSGKNSRQGVRDILDRVSAASRSDLDSLFFGDHHVTPFTYFQNTPILGRALSEWGGETGRSALSLASLESGGAR